MITLTTHMSGPEIMRAVIEDDEEFAYGLEEIIDADASALGAAVGEIVGKSSGAEIAKWLRDFAVSLELAAELDDT